MRKNIEAVISVIKNNGKTEFSISGKLYQEELKELSAAIKENPTIKRVTFSSIQFYMTDMFRQDVLRQDMLPKYIAGILLKGNISLEMINLSGNHIEDDGILYVIEALKNNETLKHLNLSRNLISNKGGKIIADSMGDNFLREVDLSNNYIDSEAMEYIRQMVKTSDLIERIFNLSNNPVGITNETIISNIDKFIDVNFLILEPNQADEVEAKATGEIVEY